MDIPKPKIVFLSSNITWNQRSLIKDYLLVAVWMVSHDRDGFNVYFEYTVDFLKMCLSFALDILSYFNNDLKAFKEKYPDMLNLMCSSCLPWICYS